MKNLIKKYEDFVLYIIFGVLTTVVNIGAYWWMAHLLKRGVMVSTIIAWLVAVLFAYVTNRQWVFHSSAHGIRTVLKEIVSFFSCRLLTGIFDWGIMLVFVNLLEFPDIIIKAGMRTFF